MGHNTCKSMGRVLCVVRRWEIGQGQRMWWCIVLHDDRA